MTRFIRSCIKFLAGCFILGVAVVALLVAYITRDLPNYEVLAHYEPAVLTRIHSENGEILAEFASKKRLYLPIESIPSQIKAAFISAEDKNFYHHIGIDIFGLMRAVLKNISHIGTDRRPVGASTITQQVAKNFLLNSDVSIQRKIKEAILALRIEKAYSKDHILELYLNEIYLGLGSYGIASAALTYFDKSVDQLTLSEIAYLASLPKGPANYNPYTHADRAIERRNWVLDRMEENGYVTKDEAEKAKAEPLGVVTHKDQDQIKGAEYFSEEVRRQLIDKYDANSLYEGGLSVRTTLMPKYQALARQTLRNGLVGYDRKRGWHGILGKIDLNNGDWGEALTKFKPLSDVPEWKIAVILKVSDTNVTVGIQPSKDLAGKISAQRESGVIEQRDLSWALKYKDKSGNLVHVRSPKNILSPGDVVFVQHKTGHFYTLEQTPKVEGAIIVMEPSTGRVLAMVGGFSYDLSQFNRATQAYRQPGSSFKPFVYAAALDNGYRPSDIVYDGPIAVDQGNDLGLWQPKNFESNFAGPRTLRYGLEHSRNLITIRLAYALGIDTVANYAERFGIYDHMPHLLSMVLGAGDTTLMRMATAYSMIANGGKAIAPSLIDRIQNRYGHTIYRHDERQCDQCSSAWEGQEEPQVIDNHPQILDPLTDYQVINLLEGVVQHGTGRFLQDLKRPVAAKTGTTNASKDAWFMAFTPDLLVGVYLGYDLPQPLGQYETGGGLAGPIAKQFLSEALNGVRKSDFPIPRGITFIPVNEDTGMRAQFGDSNVSLDPFKPGTQPSETFEVLGADFFKEGIALTPASPTATDALETGKSGLF